jgi:beta-hydroxylase
MLIGSEPIHWTEGRAFVFDDTCPHEAFNHTDEALIILRMQFERPLLQPGKQIARCFLSGIHRFATPPPAELMIV